MKARLPTPVAWHRAGRVFWLAIRVALGMWWGSRRKARLGGEAGEAAWARACRAEGERIRREALRLHGLLIKVGQFLSTRVDVLPAAFVEPLSQLLDLVPPEPWPSIEARLRASFGAWPVAGLAYVEPQAVAAASLAQVHRAHTDAGDVLALKIWRPGIEALVDADLGTLRTVMRVVARWTSWGRRFNLAAIFEEFETVTREELDTRHEAEQAGQFRATLPAGAGIDAPDVIDAFTRPGVLAMSFVEGVRLDSGDALRRTGVSGRVLADRLLHAYLRQVLVHGLFHADPHPGNILVTSDGTVVFLDFGMMGRFDAADRRGMESLLRALFSEDWQGAVDDFERLGFLRPDADRAVVRRGVAAVLSPITSGRGGNARGKRGPDLEAVLLDLRDLIYEQPFQFPARYTFLGRALGMVMGLVMDLNPEEPFPSQFRRAVWDMLFRGRDGRRQRASAAMGRRPTAGEQMGDGGVGADRGAEDAKDERAARGGAQEGGFFGMDPEEALRVAADLARLAIRLPGRLDRALAKVEAGEVSAHLETRHLAPALHHMRAAVERAGWLVLAGLAWLSSAVFAGFASRHGVWPVWVSWAAALLALLQAWRVGRRRGRG